MSAEEKISKSPRFQRALVPTQEDVIRIRKIKEEHKQYVIVHETLRALLERQRSCVYALMQTDINELQETYIKALLELNGSMKTLVDPPSKHDE